MSETTTYTTLRALADRVESEGPSRELDAEIACALRVMPDYAPKWLREWKGLFAPPQDASPGVIAAINDEGQASVNWPAPRLTSSVDAVMAIIPESAAWWSVEKTCDEHSPMRHFGPARGPWRGMIGLTWSHGSICGASSAPACALLAAVLRAWAVE